MKTLIIYMSHHGTARKVAEWLQEKFGPTTSTVVNLRNDSIPPLDEYSTIIIGGSIHMGHIQKKIQRFCKFNLTTLLQKNIGLFLCYIDEENGEDEFNNAFPSQLRDHALANGLFGGELLFTEMNFMERLATKAITSNSETITALHVPQMLQFVKTIKETANKSQTRITRITNRSSSYSQEPQ